MIEVVAPVQAAYFGQAFAHPDQSGGPLALALVSAAYQLERLVGALGQVV